MPGSARLDWRLPAVFALAALAMAIWSSWQGGEAPEQRDRPPATTPAGGVSTGQHSGTPARDG